MKMSKYVNYISFRTEHWRKVELLNYTDLIKYNYYNFKSLKSFKVHSLGVLICNGKFYNKHISDSSVFSPWKYITSV